MTSSCGRLFDAVSALIGVKGEVQYDAQAAIELEMIAHGVRSERGEYPFSLSRRNGISVIELEELFRALVKEVCNGTPRAKIAVCFHNTVARMISCVCGRISKETGLKQVVLSGGVFQNRLLLRKAIYLLEGLGLEVLTHRQVPCNDGGISLGQAVIGAVTSVPNEVTRTATIRALFDTRGSE